MISTEGVRKLSVDDLPSRMGVVINHVGSGEVRSELAVQPWLLAPNTFLHAGAVIVLADVSAGYGCIANLPAGAVGFTTVELKSNHVGTARDGTIECVAKAMHLAERRKYGTPSLRTASPAKRSLCFAARKWSCMQNPMPDLPVKGTRLGRRTDSPKLLLKLFIGFCWMPLDEALARWRESKLRLK